MLRKINGEAITDLLENQTIRTETARRVQRELLKFERGLALVHEHLDADQMRELDRLINALENDPASPLLDRIFQLIIAGDVQQLACKLGLAYGCEIAQCARCKHVMPLTDYNLCYDCNLEASE